MKPKGIVIAAILTLSLTLTATAAEAQGRCYAVPKGVILVNLANRLGAYVAGGRIFRVTCTRYAPAVIRTTPARVCYGTTLYGRYYGAPFACRVIG